VRGREGEREEKQVLAASEVGHTRGGRTLLLNGSLLRTTAGGAEHGHRRDGQRVDWGLLRPRVALGQRRLLPTPEGGLRVSWGAVWGCRVPCGGSAPGWAGVGQTAAVWGE
jgi:hypothetical protein